MSRTRPIESALLAAFALATVAACATPSAPPDPDRGDLIPTADWRYNIALDPELAHLTVEACFVGRPPGAFRPQMNASADALESARLSTPDGASSPLPVERGVIDLRGLADDACIAYTLDLAAFKSPFGRRSRDRSVLARDLALSPDYWLWTSPRRPVGRDITATLDVPDGAAIAVPWQELPDGSFRLPDSTWTLQSAGAILSSPLERVVVAGNSVRLGILGDGWTLDRAVLRHWIAEVTRTIALLWGEFPVAQTQVLLLPSDGDDVGFGSATRGGGPAVTITVGRFISERDLMNDWTAFHEFIHLGIPHLPRADSWLDEGLATYYEPILRVRAGLLSARTAFERLHDGFQRGRGSQTGRTVRAESAAMFNTYAFWAVYWSGAAIAMITDVELRSGPGGRSLDTQMRRMRDCCLTEGKSWNADALLDATALGGDAPDLGAVAARTLDRTDFPELDTTYARLGLRFDAAGHLLTRPGDPGAELRIALMGRDVEP